MTMSAIDWPAMTFHCWNCANGLAHASFNFPSGTRSSIDVVLLSTYCLRDISLVNAFLLESPIWIRLRRLLAFYENCFKRMSRGTCKADSHVSHVSSPREKKNGCDGRKTKSSYQLRGKRCAAWQVFVTRDGQLWKRKWTWKIFIKGKVENILWALWAPLLIKAKRGRCVGWFYTCQARYTWIYS